MSEVPRHVRRPTPDAQRPSSPFRSYLFILSPRILEQHEHWLGLFQILEVNWQRFDRVSAIVLLVVVATFLFTYISCGRSVVHGVVKILF